MLLEIDCWRGLQVVAEAGQQGCVLKRSVMRRWMWRRHAERTAECLCLRHDGLPGREDARLLCREQGRLINTDVISSSTL